MTDRLSVHPEIAEALAQRRPVVALESTVITHGMPAPRNLETARALEDEVRRGGAVPATIAVLDGRIRVGLEPDDVERLSALGQSALKLSRRDLAVALATGQAGSTTVSATMIAARLAGIPVFATGGIGGVHRGAEESFDISADLEELARTPVCVVCAGAKAILDLPKTMEVLETRGVPVLGFGTGEFPAFYTRSSGIPVPQRVESADEVARIALTHWRLGLDSGLVVANPIPSDHELSRPDIEAAIAQALGEAKAEGVSGKAVTPFLLHRLEAITGGASLAANVALILNNARVAASVAVALAEAQRIPGLPPKPSQTRPRYQM